MKPGALPLELRAVVADPAGFEPATSIALHPGRGSSVQQQAKPASENLSLRAGALSFELPLHARRGQESNLDLPLRPVSLNLSLSLLLVSIVLGKQPVKNRLARCLQRDRMGVCFLTSSTNRRNQLHGPVFQLALPFRADRTG